ncbi:MAG: helix-turn-helix domain-containing protein [Oscillospiraceae bacterium]|jgi:transcriptional regulator with XRE-family HTH domain|nr:helix-turn-helix domain-containing protein [Oscillospiraceae bacterium]
MKRLRQLRKEKGLSQSELAGILHMTQGMISYWEKGDFEPNITILNQLANLFGVTIDYLLERTDMRCENGGAEDIYMHLAQEARARNLSENAVRSVIALLDNYK